MTNEKKTIKFKEELQALLDKYDVTLGFGGSLGSNFAPIINPHFFLHFNGKEHWLDENIQDGYRLGKD